MEGDRNEGSSFVPRHHPSVPSHGRPRDVFDCKVIGPPPKCQWKWCSFLACPKDMLAAMGGHATPSEVVVGRRFSAQVALLETGSPGSERLAVNGRS